MSEMTDKEFLIHWNKLQSITDISKKCDYFFKTTGEIPPDHNAVRWIGKKSYSWGIDVYGIEQVRDRAQWYNDILPDHFYEQKIKNLDARFSRCRTYSEKKDVLDSVSQMVRNEVERVVDGEGPYKMKGYLSAKAKSEPMLLQWPAWSNLYCKGMALYNFEIYVREKKAEIGPIKSISNFVDDADSDEKGFSLVEYAIIHAYNKEPIFSGNAKSLAGQYGFNFSRADINLTSFYNKYKNPDYRTRLEPASGNGSETKSVNKLKRIRKIIPALKSETEKRLARDEANTLEANIQGRLS